MLSKRKRDIFDRIRMTCDLGRRGAGAVMYKHTSGGQQRGAPRSLCDVRATVNAFPTFPVAVPDRRECQCITRDHTASSPTDGRTLGPPPTGHHGLASLEGHCWCRSLRAGSEKVPRRPPWLRRRLVATAGHDGGSQGPGSATVGRPLRQKNPWTLTRRHDSLLTR